MLFRSEDFGLLVTIQIFTGTLGFLAGGGMGEALVQAKKVDEQDFKVVFTAQLVICVLIYTTLFAVSPFFSDWFNEPIYTDLLRVSGLSFIFRPFSNIPRAKLRRDMQFKKISLINIVAMAFGAIISILLALIDFGVWALIIGGLTGTLCSLFLLFNETKWVPGFAYRKDSLKRLGGYGIKSSTNEIILHIRKQIPNLIISRTLGAGQVGLFNKADSLSALPSQIIGGSTYQTVFRALSSIQTNLDQSKYIYFRTISLISVYTFPLYIGLFWTAKAFILFVYGEKWVASSMPLQILTIAGLLNCIIIPSGAVNAAQNLLGKEMRIQIEALLLFIIATLIGLPWGIIGIAAALLPCYLYFTLRMVNLANKSIHGKYSDLLMALKPALILNIPLFIVLLAIDKIIPESFSTTHPGQYFLSMVMSGGLVYIILFLFIPLHALKTEQDRWKKLLRFKMV